MENKLASLEAEIKTLEANRARLAAESEKLQRTIEGLEARAIEQKLSGGNVDNLLQQVAKAASERQLVEVALTAATKEAATKRQELKEEQRRAIQKEIAALEARMEQLLDEAEGHLAPLYKAVESLNQCRAALVEIQERYGIPSQGMTVVFKLRPLNSYGIWFMEARRILARRFAGCPE